MKVANDVVFFAIEIAMLIGFGVWGWQLGTGPWRFVLAAAVPLGVALAWAVLAAPTAATRLHDPYLLAFQLAVFALGAAALIAADHLGWGLTLGIAAALVVPLDRMLS